MITPRCFPKIIFSVHFYVCYKLCYMLKIFSFVGRGKFQTTSRASQIRWFFLRVLRASWLLSAQTLQYDIIYAPKSHSSVLNFSNFIGMKMHGSQARVNTSEWRTETLGAQVTMRLDWREPLHPCGLLPWGEVTPQVQWLLWPLLQALHLLFPLCSLPFPSAVRAETSYFVRPTRDTFSLRLFLVVFITKLASPEFSLVLCFSSCISSSLSLIL